MDPFAEALEAVRDLRTSGLIEDYAIGGAIAMMFWSEPTATFDLDVFVLIEQEGLLVSLDPIYRWARERGYSHEAEHITIAGLPVQIIPAHGVGAEAVREAAEVEEEGQIIRVIRPEYLIAMWLEGSARTRKRMERVATLLDEGVDRALLADVLERFRLELPEHLR